MRVADCKKVLIPHAITKGVDPQNNGVKNPLDLYQAQKHLNLIVLIVFR